MDTNVTTGSIPPGVQTVLAAAAAIVVLALGAQWLTAGPERCDTVSTVQSRTAFSQTVLVHQVGDEWGTTGERVTRADFPAGESQYICHQRPGIFSR